jgi:hypothetical protein
MSGNPRKNYRRSNPFGMYRASPGLVYLDDDWEEEDKSRPAGEGEQSSQKPQETKKPDPPKSKVPEKVVYF